MITSTDPLSSIILLLQCWSHSKQSPPQLQGTEAMVPTREEPQHRTVVQAAFRRTPFHGAPRVWAGLRSAQHQPSLCTPSPPHSCSGSSLQLSRISQGLCLCGIQPYSPRMCSQQLLEAARPAWPAHQQLLSPQTTAGGLQFQGQCHKCVAEAEHTQIPRAPQPPNPGCGPGKPSKALPMGCLQGLVPSRWARHFISLENGIFMKIMTA